MKTLFLGLILISSLGLSQDSSRVNLSPCDHPLIKIAQTQGLKSVPIRDIYRYNKLVKACEKEGGAQQIEQIYKNDWRRDFQKSKAMSSWTSTHAMCVFVSFAYYFAGKLLSVKPDKS